MRKSGLILLISLFVAAFILGGCRRVNNVVWSKYSHLPSEGWDPVNVMPFFPWPEDSISNEDKRYNLLLSVRYSALNNPGRLHLVVNQEDDAGSVGSDTISLDLLPPPVRPVGRGSYGVFETVDTLFRSIPLRSGYCVELQSITDPKNTKGIMDIGLILMERN